MKPEMSEQSATKVPHYISETEIRKIAALNEDARLAMRRLFPGLFPPKPGAVVAAPFVASAGMIMNSRDTQALREGYGFLDTERLGIATGVGVFTYLNWDAAYAVGWRVVREAL